MNQDEIKMTQSESEYKALESLMFHMARDLKEGKATIEDLTRITKALFKQ